MLPVTKFSTATLLPALFLTTNSSSAVCSGLGFCVKVPLIITFPSLEKDITLSRLFLRKNSPIVGQVPQSATQIEQLSKPSHLVSPQFDSSLSALSVQPASLKSTALSPSLSVLSSH